MPFASPPPPAPANHDPEAPVTTDSERALDEVLSKIDAALPKIHAKARAATQRLEPAVNGAGRRSKSPTPTKGFSPKQFKRTQAKFQAMSEESLLTNSGDDIRLECNEKAAKREREILGEEG